MRGLWAGAVVATLLTPGCANSAGQWPRVTLQVGGVGQPMADLPRQAVYTCARPARIRPACTRTPRSWAPTRGAYTRPLPTVAR